MLILVEEDLEGCLEEFVSLRDAQVGCLLCIVRLVWLALQTLNFISLPCSKQGEGGVEKGCSGTNLSMELMITYFGCYPSD